MSRVSETQTRQVAHLARLELTEAECALFTRQLGDILDYVGQLQEVDVAGIEPLVHPVELAAPLREDAVREFPRTADGASTVLQSAPDALHGAFKVPPVL